MRRSAGLVLAFVSAAALVGWATVRGTVVVRGGEHVVSAVLTNHARDQRLTRLPGGLFVGSPQLEGTVRLHCKDGSAVEWGYVTRSLHSWLDPSKRGLCNPINVR